MQYNLHPLLVHFPIALLLVYSVIKILPFKKWLPNVSWKHIERALLVFGMLGAGAALLTGDIAEEIARPNHDLVETHSLFAATATWLYGLLLAGELITFINPWIATKVTSQKILKMFSFVGELLTHPILSTTLAVLGLIMISLTGLLGGVMVYGTSADPVAPFVLKILGL